MSTKCVDARCTNKNNSIAFVIIHGEGTLYCFGFDNIICPRITPIYNWRRLMKFKKNKVRVISRERNQDT